MHCHGEQRFRMPAAVCPIRIREPNTGRRLRVLRAPTVAPKTGIYPMKEWNNGNPS